MNVKKGMVIIAAASLLPFSIGSVYADQVPGKSVSMKASQEETLKKKDRLLPVDFVEAFAQGHFSKIYQQTSKQFRQNIPFSEFENLAESFNQGVTSYQLASTFPVTKHQKGYVWIDEQKSKGIRVLFGKHGIIQGLQLAPLASFPESDQNYTSNEYSMPIKEEWMVFWGGTNQLINYHYLAKEQRYAYDLVMTKNGDTYHGNPTKNKHYYAFGKEVTSPADGKVIQVVDDIKDNVPGEMNREQPLGNYVVIEHENDEYSLLAHFKEQSISVRQGDRVESGEVLGLAGNSGNSSEPHIHFQVMDSPDIFDGNSLRIQFNSGKEPVQGDIVKPEY